MRRPLQGWTRGCKHGERDRPNPGAVTLLVDGGGRPMLGEYARSLARIADGDAQLRTRLSICARKVRYLSEEDAVQAAGRANFPLRPYRCDRCQKFHLTSRTKGKRVPLAEVAASD